MRRVAPRGRRFGRAGGQGGGSTSEDDAQSTPAEGAARNGASDEALMLRVAASGDQRALSELYDRYGGLIYASGLRYLGDGSSAEDLVQDVFTAVWLKAETFDPSRASFATWVYRIARNRATDLDRRRRARPKAAGEEPLLAIPGGERTDHLARSFDLAEALARLSPSQREVLVLAYFKGLSQREIALATGAPLGTIKTRTTAALKALRSIMGPAEGRPDGG